MSKFAELPDGTKLEFPDDTQDSVIDSVVKKHLGVSQEASKIDNTLLRAKAGAANLSNRLTAGTVGALSMGVDKLVSAVSGEDYNSPVTDWLTKNIIGPNLQTQEDAKQSAKQHTDLLGQASTIAGDFVGMAPSILMGAPLQSVTTAVPRLGASVFEAALPAIQKGFAGGLPLTSLHASKKYEESAEKGNSPLENISAASGGVLSMGAQTIAPMGMAGDLGKRVVTGALSNVPLGMGGRAIENMSSPANMQQNVSDPAAMVTDALTGGLMHGALGARADAPTNPLKEPSIKPEVEGEGQTYADSLKARVESLSHQRDYLIDQYKELDVDNPTNKQVAARERVAEKLTDVKQQLDNLLKEEGVEAPVKPVEETLSIPERYVGKEQEYNANLSKQIEGLQRALDKQTELIQQKHSSENPEDIAGVELLMDGQIQLRNNLNNKIKTQQELQRYMKSRTGEIESLPPVDNSAKIERKQTLIQTIKDSMVNRKESSPEAETAVGAKLRQSDILEAEVAALQKQQPKASVQAEQRNIMDVDSLYHSVKDANRLIPNTDPTFDWYKEAQALRDIIASKIQLVASNKLTKKQESVIDYNIDKTIKWFKDSTGAHPFDDKYDVKLEPHKAIETSQGDTTPLVGTTVTRYTKAIESGDVMTAVKEVANGSGNPALRVVANALLSKGFLKDVKIKIEGGLNSLGKFFYEDGSIALRSASKNPHVFIHELLHRVTAGRLELYRQGHRFDRETNRAIESLYKLHGFLVDKHYNSLKEAMGDAVARTIGKSADELLAHGLTDIRFQAWLNTIKYRNDTAKSAFVDKLADFFGFNRAQKTALQKTFEVGDVLIKKSKGEQAYDTQGPLLAIDPNKDLGYSNKVELLDKVANFPNKVAMAAFTPNIPIIYKGHPIIDNVANFVRKAQKQYESLRNDIFGGSITQAHYDAKTGKMFYPLSKIETGTGLLPSVKAVSKEGYDKVTDVLQAFQEGMNIGRDYRDTIKAYSSSWSSNQKAFANNLIRMSTKLLAAENNLRSTVGLNPVVRKPGFFPAIRQGDHVMVLMRNGTPYHYEHFVSKAQAMRAIEKANKAGETATYKPFDNSMDNPTLLEVLQDVDARIQQGTNPAHVLEGAMFDATNAQAGMTSHAKARTNMPGHIGTEIGVGKIETGKRFAHGLEGFVKQYLDGIRKRQIQWEKEQYYQDNKPMVDNMPNAREIADHYADSVSGNIRGPEWVQDMSKSLRDGIDSIRELIPEDSKREAHVLDRFTGITGGLFYKFVLTQKFSVWVSQLATTLNAARDFYEPGTRPLDVIGGIGDSFKALTNPSRDFLDGMKYVSQSLDTFHPQLTNELNTIRLFDNLPDAPKKLLDILTGEKIITGTDALSRFMTYNTFYHIYKRQGLSGKALWEKAADAADRNMYVYGRTFQPSMYKSMGVVGENMTPLKTFAHNQTGLLIADTKRMLQSTSPKEAAQSVGSLLTTLTVLMATGGALSIPLIAEYELLRKLAMSMGLDADRLPSAVEWAMKQDPYLSRGLVSGATGIDIGASMRYHTLVEGMVEGDNMFKTLFPSLGWAGSMTHNMSNLLVDSVTGDMTKQERRAMQRKILPKGYIGAGMSDIIGIRDKENITMGTQGESLLKTTPLDTVASYMGSRTVKQANTSDFMRKTKEKDDQRKVMINKATGFLVENNVKKALELYEKAGVDPNKIDDYALSLLYKQDVPAFDRYIANKKGQIKSFEHQRRFQQSQEYIEGTQ